MGGSDSGTRVSVQVLVLVMLTVTLFAAAGYVPVLGIIVSLLAPTPLLLVTLRHGLRMGLLALSLATLSLALLFGGLQSAIFFAEYGVMALTMAEAIRRRWSVEKTLLVATAIPLLTTSLVMAVLLSSIGADLNTLSQYFESDFSQTLRQYFAEGGGSVDGDLHIYIQEALTIVMQLLPSLVIISTAAGALANYGVVRSIWRRTGDRALFREMTLTRWKAPEACVWVLIAAGLCSFLPVASLRVVGLNVLLLVSLIYLIQGLGIMVFYLNKTSVPPLFRSIAYLFLVIQPLLLLGVAAFGLFDLWFDFRRTSNKREESQ
jgi:uncharacterized protein YybS (DUF2232 family)